MLLIQITLTLILSSTVLLPFLMKDAFIVLKILALLETAILIGRIVLNLVLNRVRSCRICLISKAAYGTVFFSLGGAEIFFISHYSALEYLAAGGFFLKTVFWLGFEYKSIKKILQTEKCKL